MKLVERRVGRMYVCNGKCTVCNRHDYESKDNALLMKRLKKGNCFLDIGAHCGLYAVNAANIMKDMGEIHAFEMRKESLQSLRSNAKLYPQITVHDVAAWDENTTMSYRKETGFPACLYPESDNKQKVKAVRLDDYFSPTFTVDVVKLDVDVDGGEICVLKGMTEIMKRSKQVWLLLEFNAGYQSVFGVSSIEILDWLKEQGFRSKTYSENKLRKLKKGHLNVWFYKE